MKLLDLFCGAGGAAMGYYRAGFTDITGIDIKPMPRYPFKFIQGDALEYLAEHGAEYDVIHASPPCQHYSEQTQPAYRNNHPDLIAHTRNFLNAIGKPYIIENVEMARSLLVNPVMLCGSMFALKIWRHRYFEIYPIFIMSPMSCNHGFDPILITGQGSYPKNNGKRYKSPIAEKRQAIGIDWMTTSEITEAIPPAYTEFIGRQLMRVLEATE